jgi:hypothetical protein
MNECVEELRSRFQWGRETGSLESVQKLGTAPKEQVSESYVGDVPPICSEVRTLC